MNDEIIYTHRTRSGLKARIVCNNAIGKYPVIALILSDNVDEEFCETFTEDLKHYNFNEESDLDLFEYNPWQDVAVDTPVYVSYASRPDDWHRRHFAKFANGVVYVWEDGRTSWTTPNMVMYKYAKLVTG